MYERANYVHQLAVTGDIPNIKRRHLPKREWVKREIRKLLIAGHTNDAISNELQIPKRTLDRYLQQIFANDPNLLDSSKEQLEEQVQRFRLQLGRQLEDLLSIAFDKQEDGGIRLQAHELCCEIGYARMNLVFDTPARVARALGNNHFRSNKLVEKQSGLDIKLKLVKDPRSQLPSRYDVIQ